MRVARFPWPAFIAMAIGCGDTAPPEDAASTTGTSSSDDTGVAESSTGVATSVGPADSTDTTSGSTSTDSTGEAPPTVPTIGPTVGPLTLDFQLSLAGAGSLDVGDIAITDGYGTVQIGGRTHPIIVHERQGWPSERYTLYQSIAVAEDAWTILWFYCSDDALTNIYLESTDGIALHYEIGTGTCEGLDGPVTVDVELPGTALDVVANGAPFSIQGPEVSIENGVLGSLSVGGTEFVVAPFETVDCTTCGMGGWYEIHMMLWDPIAGRMCFAIGYLSVTGQVQFVYAISLPDLSDPLGGQVWLAADWTFG